LFSIVASYFGNRNILLLIGLVLASSAFVTSLRWERPSKDRVFIAVLWCVALSLLLSETLVSNDLLGYDVHQEFLTFLRVSEQGTWDPTIVYNPFRPNFNSVLSITILPLIIKLVSGLGEVAVFKFVFPILFSIVPVLLYKICRRLLDPEGAFLSVFLFISYPAFWIEMIGLVRQEVGEVILVVILLVLLSPKLKVRAGSAALIFLFFGLVVSHYSLAFICIFALVLLFLYSKLFRTMSLGTGSIILTGLVLTISWYAFVSQGSVVTSLTAYVTRISQGILTDFLSPGARPATVETALGLAVLKGTFHNANRVLQYAIQFILILGFLHLAFKRGKNAPEKSLYPLMAIGLALIGSLVVLPYFAEEGLNLTRTYSIALIFAAPCFAYGTYLIESIFSKARLFPSPKIPTGISARALLTAVLLFSYLLFNTGWFYAMSMEQPYSFILDSERMMHSQLDSVKATFFNYYTAPEDVAASQWLKSYVPSDSYVCNDVLSGLNFLTAYAERTPQYADTCDTYVDMYNTPHGHQVLKSEAYVYLSVLNSRSGLWPVPERYQYRLVDLRSRGPTDQNRIYSNGGTTIL
jgi:uncharacterized membrane protein